MPTIGDRLKEARRLAMLTQMELATRAGVSIVTVARLESNAIENPRVSTVKTLAAALDIEPRWLLFGDDMGKAAA